MAQEWIIKKEGFVKEEITSDENRFFCGNGYLGVRGFLAEFEKEYLPAVNLAGVYDRVGDGWREPVNAPNPFYLRVWEKENACFLPEGREESHRQQIDFRHGVLSRETVFSHASAKITLRQERFASMQKEHLLCQKTRVTADRETGLEIMAGIDGGVWDIHGPHLHGIQFYGEKARFCMEAATQEKGIRVAVAVWMIPSKAVKTEMKQGEKKLLRKFSVSLAEGESFELETFAAVFTSLDTDDPREKAMKFLENLLHYEDELEAHEMAWERLWKKSEVLIEGDEKANEALNYSFL